MSLCMDTATGFSYADKSIKDLAQVMMDRKYINLQNQVKTAKFQEFLTDILRSSTELLDAMQMAIATNIDGKLGFYA